MKRGAFVLNKYYTDEGMEYVFARLQNEFAALGVTLDRRTDLYAAYPFCAPDCDFCVFWDKDVALAHCLERAGKRVFNSAYAIAACDDKEKTFAALEGKVPLPATVAAPLVYDVSVGADERFLSYVERTLGYPVVVKACVGSQGRQVFKADTFAELRALHEKLIHTPHLFQAFIASARQGEDVRVYVVGGKVAGAVERSNTTDFRSNVACGGTMRRIRPSAALCEQAERAAQALRLEYGSVDFMASGDTYACIEANSAPYMQNAEKAGIPLARSLASYITEVTYGAGKR